MGHPRLPQDLRGPRVPFFPFPVLSYHLPCTWVCPNVPSSGLLPQGFLRCWADLGSRKASWQVNCSCSPVLHFFHRFMWDWAARMALTWWFQVTTKHRTWDNTLCSWPELHVWVHVSILAWLCFMVVPLIFSTQGQHKVAPGILYFVLP